MLATSPAGSVFEGLAEAHHQKLLLASHARVLAGYALVALGAWALAFPVVRLWIGNGPASRWGVVARTLAVLGLVMAHGWLRLVHTQPYFLGEGTYDTWYFRQLNQWPEEVRARVMFVLFRFLPALVVVAAAGVYVVEAARWFRGGGRLSRLTLAGAVTAAVLIAGWLMAPHFIGRPGQAQDGRPNLILLSTDELRTPPMLSSPDVHQPTLASLAADSVVFTNMRSPLATALAEATSLQTGQAPHTHGLLTPYPSDGQVARALASGPRLPALLQAQGYTTAVMGGDAADAYAVAQGLGFSEVEAGAASDYTRHLAGTVYPAHFIIPAWLDNRLGRRLLPHLAVLPGSVDPDVVTERLTERLELGAREGTPFFIHGLYAQPATVPHSPGAAPKDQAPATFDGQLKRVLDCLEQNGLRENTILVVMGQSSAAHPPGRPTDSPVPVVLHVPGHAFPTGSTDQLARLFDLAPTLLDVLGLPPEPAMDGVSLRPVLQNPDLRLPVVAFGESAGFSDVLPTTAATPLERATFREAVRLDPASGYRLVLNDPAEALHRKTRWVRTTQWQLVFTPAVSAPDQADTWQLYDLRSDPSSRRDVKLQNPKVWQTLEVALRRWADENQESRLTEIFPEGEPPAAVLPGT